MKWMIASDLHGSAYYCRKMLEAFEREGADPCRSDAIIHFMADPPFVRSVLILPPPRPLSRARAHRKKSYFYLKKSLTSIPVMWYL